MNVCFLEEMCFKLKGRDKKKFERQGREGIKKWGKMLFFGKSSTF